MYARTLLLAIAVGGIACADPVRPAASGVTDGQPIAQGVSSPSNVDTGTVIVHVRTADGTPVYAAHVTLGTWTGDAQTFRDSTSTGALVPETSDSRFHEFRSAEADANGEVRFAGVDKHQRFAVRAARGTAAVYFPSLFWLYTSSTIELHVQL